MADNGKGFDTDKVLKGNGLDGMQKRAEEMGAEYLL
jgi:signal transduction histidine kinase